MDIALCIEHLVPAAKYGGVTRENTRDEYARLRWEDERAKPTWEALEAVATQVAAAEAAERALEAVALPVTRGEMIDILTLLRALAPAAIDKAVEKLRTPPVRERLT